MDTLDLSQSRTGGLMLCECGHLKAAHFHHAKWFGGPLTRGASCVHCAGSHRDEPGCPEFKAGSFQGYKFEEEAH